MPTLAEQLVHLEAADRVAQAIARWPTAIDFGVHARNIVVEPRRPLLPVFGSLERVDLIALHAHVRDGPHRAEDTEDVDELLRPRPLVALVEPELHRRLFEIQRPTFAAARIAHVAADRMRGLLRDHAVEAVAGNDGVPVIGIRIPIEHALPEVRAA